MQNELLEVPPVARDPATLSDPVLYAPDGMCLAILLICCSALVLCFPFGSDSTPIDVIPKFNVVYDPSPIDTEVYTNLYTYAHLIDIAYCVDKFHRIEKPFNCELNCASRFPNMTLVHQWFFDDAVCGYIASTTSNIFLYNDTVQQSDPPKKTIVVSLRGTRSFADTVADLKVEMIQYMPLVSKSPFCGNNCKVHKGFWVYFYNTLTEIDNVLDAELDGANCELVIVGHSLGGSVALLLALHYISLGHSKITLVTMGQPLVGNKEFTTWADYMLGSYMPVAHNTFGRKFIRVIHKNDIVTTIPRVGTKMFERYHQFDNQIYLDVAADNTHPPPENVVDCYTGENGQCIAGDLHGHEGTYLVTHNTYFRYMGRCGIRIP